MTKLSTVDGIGPEYELALKKVGVRSLEDLLKRGATSSGRSKLEATSGIRGSLILEWVNHADLFRIDGVGEEYSDLLEEAGVDTVVELARRNPANLFTALAEINAQKKLVRRLPTLKQVTYWVECAKRLDRIIEY